MAKSGVRELKGHAKNSNKGTERGAVQLEESVKRYGFGRSIVVDRNGIAIAGNHVLDVAQEKNAPIRVIETDGRELVVVKRTDLDLEQDGGRAAGLAIADNRTSETGLSWDADRLAEEISAGLDVGFLFREDELEALLKDQAKQEADDAAGGGGDGLKTVKLPMTTEQFNEFSDLVKQLMEDNGTTDVVGTVMLALRNAAGGGRA